MRIAVLWKRRYMGQDVITDRYARLYEFPRGLAASGHGVLALCLNYHRGQAESPLGHWSGKATRWGLGGLVDCRVIGALSWRSYGPLSQTSSSVAPMPPMRS